MAYSYRKATEDLLDYLELKKEDVKIIDNTNGRGFVCKANGEDIVIFVYPISCKENNRQNFFDTRDSGAAERKVTWNYACENKMKYFCLGINTEQERYRNYVLSLESSEDSISRVSYRKAEFSTTSTGTQVNIPNDFIPSGKVERILTPKGFYIVAIKKDFIWDYLELFDNRPYLFNADDSYNVEDSELSDEKTAENIILYGVPGCGKSHEIKDKYCNDDRFMERAVFHPDYTYSDFVGQILPKVNTEADGSRKITYLFEPGPFTRILKEAEEDKEHFYFLVVEEINRGNAPAIFGDIFQLLDRDDNGESEYGISNEAIAEYVYGDKSKKITIPSNLFILATMNTSDQNVFTLDTAFKRRWSMKRIENNIDGCKYGTHKVCNTGVEWRVFAKTVNDLIIDISTENLSNEDNRLGAYFVKESELDDADKFGEKVLMYLWNDAFKYDHDKVFKAKYHTLDELIDGFKTDGLNVFEKADLFVKTPIGDAVIEGRQVDVDRYLEGKKDYLIAYYKGLLEAVKGRVPETKDTSTGSLQYAAWRSDNISKSSFADVYLQSDKMVVFTEIPKKPKSIGEELENDGHKNHYYRIEYSEDMISEIVEIIVESYEQLKKGDADA